MISLIKSKFLCQKRLFRVRYSLMLASLALMAACSPTITSVCPPVQQYSKQFNQSLANEIEDLPDNSLIVRVISDYINLRDQLKICRSK